MKSIDVIRNYENIEIIEYDDIKKRKMFLEKWKQCFHEEYKEPNDMSIYIGSKDGTGDFYECFEDYFV